MVIGGLLITAAIWFLDARTTPNRDLVDILFFPALSAWIAYRQISKEREKWDSFVLEFSDERLIRTLPEFPTLEIAANDVTKVVDSSFGVLIRTKSRLQTLLVPRELLDYQEFRGRLGVWAPAAEVIRETSSFQRLMKRTASLAWCVVLFGSPLYLMYTPHRELIIPLGVGSMICFLAIIIVYRRSPNVPLSFRTMSWLILVLPALAMFSRLAENH